MSADGIKALIMFLITNVITAVGSLQHPVSSLHFSFFFDELNGMCIDFVLPSVLLRFTTLAFYSTAPTVIFFILHSVS